MGENSLASAVVAVQPRATLWQIACTTMNPKDEAAFRKELDQIFDSGEVFDAKPEELKRHLRRLAAIPASAHMYGDMAQTAYVIRALTINHLQMARTIAELESTIKMLNAENGKISKWVCRLTWVCAGCAVIQAVGVIWMMSHAP